MKIILLNPPRTYYKGSEPKIRLGLPIGLLSIASFIKQKHEVKIIDCLLTTRVIKENKSFTHGIEEKKIIDKIRKYEPAIVGISAPFTSQVNNMLRMAQLIKSIDRKIIIIVGGPHISVNPAIIKDKNIDYGISAEGEYSFNAFLSKKPFKKIPGLIFKKQGKIIINRPKIIKKLDSLPYPSYELIDMEKYFKLQKEGLCSRPGLIKSKREVSIITSRGCPYNCIFCAIHLHMGKKWRAHSSDFVLKHIKYLQKKYNAEHFHFEDDNLTLNKERFNKILDGLNKLNKKITWDTPNGIRVDSLDRPLLEKMKESGLTHLFLGIESGDQRILNEIVDKRLDLNKTIEIAKHCKELKIPLSAFFVIGFPGEKEENIKKTIDFSLILLKKYDVYGPPMLATPLIGTKLYNLCKKNNYFAGELTPQSFAIATSLSDGRKGMIKTADFTPELLEKYSNHYIKSAKRLLILKTIKHPFKYLVRKWKM